MLPCNSAICSLPFQPAPSGSSARNDNSRGRNKNSRVETSEVHTNSERALGTYDWAVLTSEEVAQVAEALDLQQAAVAGLGTKFVALQHPGVMVGNKDGVQSGLQRGIDVGLGTVADHPGAL